MKIHKKEPKSMETMESFGAETNKFNTNSEH